MSTRAATETADRPAPGITGPHPPACGACRRHLRQLDKLIATIQDDLLAPLTQPERDQLVQPERDQLVQLLARLLDHHARAAPQPTGDQPA